MKSNNKSALMVGGAALIGAVVVASYVYNKKKRGHPDVFLGGSCNPTTWRKDIAIPLLESSGVSYYNPQVDEWSEELIEIERKAKEEADSLLFYIDDQTRGLVSIGEANEAIASGRKVFLVMKMLTEGCKIDGQPIDNGQLKDINRAREYLKEVADKYNVRVYDEIEECIKDICKEYGRELEKLE